ncbi:methyltransferase domain-containing protein [Vibrio sp. D404a]|uniref:class I SAM-dependent DNA methyltransferase n=1 Tax=unclassified Vibrio TaxID=2614977 RepID=UPI002554E358|nr:MULTISPECIES: methyltransferase domain-containing protein [unclassified Vibrio]MDK9737381.1 methyltransferase domain-containing protein [Vibrio sp. D404a]MDK9797943.1 methyltransferase domain-containing protein [Vibrio sp. D449a]
MAKQWDEYAKDWENDPTAAEFAKAVFDQLSQLVNLNGTRVLDFGCGTGLLSQKVSPFAKEIIALDFSEAMIEELDKKELPNVEPVVDILSRGLAAQHPAFRKQFDVVVASSVCGFIPNLQDTVSLIYTLLEEDGLFVHWDWCVESDDEASGLTLSRSENVLSAAGFSDVEVAVPFSIDTPQGKLKVLMGVGRKQSYHPY